MEGEWRINSAFCFFFLGILAFAAEPTPKFLFEIPVYPGTAQIFSLPSDFSTLQPPFVTVEKIYKTTDAKSLDPIAVVAFYRSYFMVKGWRSSGGSLAYEPHSRMSVHVFEHLADGTHIQLSGDFYLLVVRKGNTITVPLSLRTGGYLEVVREDKILVLINSPRGDRREIVRKLAAGLRDE